MARRRASSAAGARRWRRWLRSGENPFGCMMPSVDSPEELRRQSHRIYGGPHDGEGRELNLWPGTGRGLTQGRWWLFAVIGPLQLSYGIYELLATSDSGSGVVNSLMGVLWVLNALFIRRAGRTS